MKNLTLLLLIGLAQSCITRAPSDYELDRRAGLIPSDDLEKVESQLGTMTQTPSSDKTAQIPGRGGSKIEKIWVYDQELDNEFWMQGTYIFLEVTPNKWFGHTGGSK